MDARRWWSASASCRSLDGKLYVLDLAKGTELKHYDLDGAITGSPAVAAGRLLVGTEKGTLYCFGAKK